MENDCLIEIVYYSGVLVLMGFWEFRAAAKSTLYDSKQGSLEMQGSLALNLNSITGRI